MRTYRRFGVNKILLKQIIQEQAESAKAEKPVNIIKRDVQDSAGLPGKTGRHAVVITGIRRCGKSTLMRTIRNMYYENDSYSFSFEDERLVGFEAAELNMLFECFLELYGEKSTIFLDEIQNVGGWEAFVRRQQDAGYKFFITGSNASLLGREMGTKLTGRNIRIELYPFSFSEYLNFTGSDADRAETSKEKAKIKRAFNIWLKNGGMPEYLKYNDPAMLKHVYDDILYRDIAVRYGIKNVKVLRELALYMLSNTGRRFSYNSTAKFLGLGSMNTVKSFLDYMENSYMIFVVHGFDFSLKKQFLSEKKAYCVDNGLAGSVTFGFSEDKGRYLENAVFMELKRRGKDVYYYTTKNGREVDFIARGENNKQALIQVCFEMESPKTRKREITALTEAMEETGIKNSLIITDDREEKIKTDSGVIEALPAYRWMTAKDR